MAYVLDTVIFNRLVDGKFALTQLPEDAELIATHIQLDELNNTPNEERRARLFLRFVEIVEVLVPTESLILGISRLGHAKLGTGQPYSALKTLLDSKNSGKSNNVQDALIAEVALVQAHILVTADQDLVEVVEQLGGQVLLVP